jgi:hypothetical protein
MKISTREMIIIINLKPLIIGLFIKSVLFLLCVLLLPFKCNHIIDIIFVTSLLSLIWVAVFTLYFSLEVD